jgi:simple sugar transport system ATP-binding protein
MRGGQTIATEDPAAVSLADLARMMVGTAPPDDTAPPGTAGDVRLQLHDIAATRDDGVQSVRDVSLTVSAGQIYGIAGVGGNGQTELAEVLMGVRTPQAGRVVLDGAEITHAHPRRRRARGMSSVPADRFRYGLAADLSVSENFTATGLNQGTFGSPLWVARRKVRRDTEAAIESFEIHGATVATRARLLSGGNAQKLVLARELSGSPSVIVAHSPTRGLDVRAAAAVHDTLRQARDDGAAVLLISEDLDEVLNLSDVAGVINRGRIVGEFSRPIDRQAVGGLMVGHA